MSPSPPFVFRFQCLLSSPLSRAGVVACVVTHTSHKRREVGREGEGDLASSILWGKGGGEGGGFFVSLAGAQEVSVFDGKEDEYEISTRRGGMR